MSSSIHDNQANVAFRYAKRYEGDRPPTDVLVDLRFLVNAAQVSEEVLVDSPGSSAMEVAETAAAPEYHLPEEMGAPPAFTELCKKHFALFGPSVLSEVRHNITHSIILTKLPRKVHIYRLPLAYQAEVKRTFDAMLANHVIRESSAPFASPLLVQKKKSGELRPCIDYRALNEVTVNDAYPLPRIDEMVAKVNGAVFSSIDLKDGYHHIPLDERAIPLTAVSTPWGMFEFLRLPFGLKTAPSSFQRFVNHVLHGVPNIVVYIDDILVFTKDKEQHLTVLTMVFQRLAQYGLVINGAKSAFFRERVTFLGFDFMENEHRPTQDAMPKLTRLTEPRTKRQLQAFLGVIGYYRYHIPRLAEIAVPLYNVMGSTAKFRWGSEQRAAFQELKELVCKRLPLAAPDFTKPFSIYTDASEVAMGAVLLQEDRIVGFYSRKFKGPETRYSAFDREALALVAALKHYRYLLIGAEAVVFTDHKPLISWVSSPLRDDLSSRHIRWLMAIQDLSVTFRYVKGPDNVMADFLSRPPGESRAPVEASKCEAESDEEGAPKGVSDAMLKNPGDDPADEGSPEAAQSAALPALAVILEG